MPKKIILLTGGNSGLGLHAAGQLARKGAKVVITARTEEKAVAACRSIREIYGQEVAALLLDLADFDSVRRCAAEFLSQYERLDCIIHNAGLNLSDRRETAQGFEYVLGVNQLGPMLLTDLLLDRLRQHGAARIVCMSSAAHMGARKGIDWDDLQRTKKYNGQTYCQVKLGTIYWVQELARKYADDGISVYAVNPRMVATNFAQDGDTSGFQKWFFKLGKYWMLKPEDGCKTMIWCATQPGIEALSGQYFQDCAPRKPSSQAIDAKEAAKRWVSVCEAMVEQGHP